MHHFSMTMGMLALVSLGTSGYVSAATMPNPSWNPKVIDTLTLHSGPDSIDPTGDGSRDVDKVYGNSTKAELESLSGFAVLQDFTGLKSVNSGADTNIVHFDDANRADLKFTITGESDITGGSMGWDTASWLGTETGKKYATSGSSAYTLTSSQISSGNSYQVELDFGKYDSDAKTWDGSVLSPTAVGFTVANIFPGITIEATFYRPDNTELATETFTGTANQSALFTYKADGNDTISRIVITKTIASDAGTPNATQSIDDVGYTAVPEPGSAGLLIGAGLLLARRRNR